MPCEFLPGPFSSPETCPPRVLKVASSTSTVNVPIYRERKQGREVKRSAHITSEQEAEPGLELGNPGFGSVLETFTGTSSGPCCGGKAGQSVLMS